MEETKRQVKESLKSHSHHDTTIIDHDAILASLQHEIDSHNNDDHSGHATHSRSRRHHDNGEERRSNKFRFKSGTAEPTKRKHSSRHDQDRRHRRRKRHQRETNSSEEGAHPFPREPTQPDTSGYDNSNAAFRESLFDALADDEGAAYWENVYNQPIHVFARSTVENANGELEEMNDDEYSAYVQTKMWEKKNPHIVLERERKEKQRLEEEEERARQREEYVRKKQRAAWEREQYYGAKKFAGLEADDDYEYVFDFDDRKGSASKRVDENAKEQHEYREAWKKYLSDWDILKAELLNAPNPEPSNNAKSKHPAKRIPWPVLQSKPVIKPNIEDFMRKMPREKNGPSREQVLKAERVKWHPDKVQQRFAGAVDEGTMKIVTGVFQVVDALLEEERKR